MLSRTGVAATAQFETITRSNATADVTPPYDSAKEFDPNALLVPTSVDPSYSEYWAPTRRSEANAVVLFVKSISIGELPPALKMPIPSVKSDEPQVTASWKLTPAPAYWLVTD